MLIKVTPTVTAGAYHANDCVGGKQTIEGAIRIPGAQAVLNSLVIQDLAAQNAVLRIFLFQADPTAGTYTDNAECDIHDTDHANCIGVISVEAADYVSAKDNSVATVKNLGLLIQATTGTSIYAVVKTTGTPTYAAVSDLKFIYGIIRD